jgi:signal transduction histidine kinase
LIGSKGLGELTHPAWVLSPWGWLLLTLSGLAMGISLLRPSLGQALSALALSAASALAVLYAQNRWLIAKQPKLAPAFFLSQSGDRLAKAGLKERVALFETLQEFPSRFARQSVALFFLGSAPAVALAAFSFNDPSVTSHRLFRLFLLEAVLGAFLYGAVYVEAGQYLSRRLAELHARHDWSDLFRKAGANRNWKAWGFHEHGALVGLWFFLLSLQAMVTATESGGVDRTVTTTVVCGLCSFVLFARLWYLNRSLVRNCLTSIAEAIDSFGLAASRRTLPLSASPLLSCFAAAFNTLSDRIRSYEEEIGGWVFHQAEESRERAVGEFSSVIVHDLAAPLHVLSFCIDQLNESPERVQDPEYLAQLKRNRDRAVDLVNSWKAYLRNPATEPLGTDFHQAYRHALQLLSVRFLPRDLSRVRFEADPRLKGLLLGVSQSDLIHILSHLLANSVHNLLTHQVPGPRIEIDCLDAGGDRIVVGVRDNGTGLDAARFEQLTAFSYSPKKVGLSEEGMGLRLVRRLVERYAGTLTAEKFSEGSGTEVRLGLPRAAQNQLEWERVKSHDAKEHHLDT